MHYTMNKFFASTLFAAMVFSATSASAQGRGDFSGDTPLPCGQVYGNASVAPVGFNKTTRAGLPMHSPTSHEYNKPSSHVTNRSLDRGYTQRRFIVIAAVVPMSLDNRSQGQRTLRTSAPTKSAAISRMRQMIDAIGVPVNVISVELVSF
jgi:hypothetical protein